VKYLTVFHANLNYAFLEPPFYEDCIRASYETIIDTFRERCPEARYTFEASGYTVEQIAKLTPDVLEKLKDAIERGQCEFMGSPYAHPCLALFPEEDGRWANEFAMRTYEKYLGFRPESAWNPECTWMQYVPRTFRDVGFKYLTLDYESFKISTDKEYGWAERNRSKTMQWGGHLPYYDVDPDDPCLHKPFRDIVPGLSGMTRSDRLAGKSVGYFRGLMDLEEYLDNVRHWSGTKGEGALLILADDAEYTGTTGYFYIKHEGDYTRTFSRDDDAADKLEALVNGVMGLGQMITFKEACEMEPAGQPYFVEDQMAWHRVYVTAWGRTPEALRYDPQIALIRQEYKDALQEKAESDPAHKELVEKFWFHLTCAENSDGRWPPPPRKTCPFNREWVEAEIKAARAALEELKKAVGPVEASTEPPEPVPEEVPDVALDKLNHVQLQEALYAARHLYDDGDKDEAKAKLALVYDEYARRGIKNVLRPRLP